MMTEAEEDGHGDRLSNARSTEPGFHRAEREPAPGWLECAEVGIEYKVLGGSGATSLWGGG